MPLPWKKTKVSRISRLVADLQSPKRGGSLVVETGFPTSLIDLFVKNRDRLREKKKKKKKNSSKRLHSESSSDLIMISSENSLTGSVSVEDNVLRLVKEEEEQREMEIDVGCGGYEEDSGENNGVEEFMDCDDGSRAKSVVIAGLRVFVVVALALSTKKLTVGITVSAFALVFLEYAGKHLVCLHKPCSKALMGLDSFIQNVFSLFRSNKCLIVEEEEIGDEYRESRKELVVMREESCTSCVNNSAGLICSVESNASIEEIESVETGSDVIKRVEEITVELDKRCMEKRRSFVEKNEDGGEILLCNKNWHSKSAKIKAKFVKKLVPKRLRSTKRGGIKDNVRELELSRQLSCGFVADLSERIGAQEQHEKGEKQEGDDELKLYRSQSEVEDESRKGIQGFDNEICRSKSDGEVVAVLGLSVVEERVLITEAKGNSGFTILVLIVLAGLGVGRFIALLLTVVCCLIVGCVGRLNR